MKPDWKAAFNILMDYWDYIPEEEHESVDKKLRIALNEQNSPLKPSSPNYDRPPKDCIKKALKRLKDQYGFGIPDKSEEWKKDPIVLQALKEEFN